MKTCEHLMPRSSRHPIADLPCGVNALFERAEDKQPLCGTHALYWKRRGYVIIDRKDAP